MTLKTILRQAHRDKPFTSWNELLNRVVFSCSTTLQETMGKTPFLLIHSFQPGANELRSDMSMSLPSVDNVSQQPKCKVTDLEGQNAHCLSIE